MDDVTRAILGDKLIPPEEAIRLIRPGDFVLVPWVTMPHTVLSALTASPVIKEIRLRVASGMGQAPWAMCADADLQVETSFVLTPEVRRLVRENRVDFCVEIPMVSRKLLGEGREDYQAVDVAILEVSPPDEKGYCSFGPAVMDKNEVIAQARNVIAEINPRFFRTFGENAVHVSKIDAFVEAAMPSGWARPPLEEEMRGKDVSAWQAAAGHVNSLVRDKDTIFYGAGGIEGMIAFGVFDGKNGLGWHTERIPRGGISLIQSDPERFMGRHKTLDPGKVVCTCVAITEESEIEFLSDNPLFELRSQHYTNNPAIIGAQERLLAVTGALAMDLTGAIAAEGLGTDVFSGPGGHTEAMFGALLSRGGRSIVVLPSTAAGGTKSRIVPQLDPLTPVTTPRHLTDYVVTEYGIARLLGKTRRQRCEELINVSHPDFREELRRKARRLYF